MKFYIIIFDGELPKRIRRRGQFKSSEWASE